MVPSGPPNGVGSAQSMPSSLLRSNSGLLGQQPGPVPSQQPFPSLVSPRAQYNGVANGNALPLLSGISNVSSLLNHSFGNGIPNSGGVISAQQRGVIGNGSLDILASAEPDSIPFPSSTGSLQGQHLRNMPGNQIEITHSHSQSQQLNAVQNFSQQQLRVGLGNASSMSQVKLESQIGSNDQTVIGQQLQSMRGIGSVKIEPSQLHSVRSLGSMKLDQQHSETSLLIQQHQQQHSQQQLLQMPRSAPHATSAAAQMNLLQQQRLLQLQQQQQQQQLFKSLPQRTPHQQLLQQSLPTRPQMKPTLYEPGMCARRLTQYMYHQQRRPEDNNIDFWRKFVTEFYAPNAKKRWCVSLYGSGRQTTGVFPQDAWHCELCNRKPGRGFEATVEVLPRLLQIKYASGTLEELLYVDMPRESQNASGQIVLDYAKAVQESVFEHLRVVRDGQLRIVFNPDLKISSWEFCARRHEELIPRRLIIPQVSNLGNVVQKYQTASQNSSAGLSLQDLQNTCTSFVVSARQLAKALEVPLVNDLGYTKRYVRCLQISEVVNCMKDLIDYSRDTGTGPMDSLINFPRINSHSTGIHSQPQLQEQNVLQTSFQNEQNSFNSHGTGISSSSNSTAMVNSSLCAAALVSTSGTSVINLFHQNSMNLRQDNLMGSSNNIYDGGNIFQISSVRSSNSLPASQPISTSSFLPIPTSYDAVIPIAQCSLINPTALPSNIHAIQEQTSQSREPDLPDSQSSVQQILHEIMFSSQLNGVSSMRNDMKGVNTIATADLNSSNCIVGNEISSNQSSNSGIDCNGFGVMGGSSSSITSSGLRISMPNTALTAHSLGMSHMPYNSSVISHQQQQDMENRLLASLGTVKSFNNMQFDWRPSP